mmetsp:Transcript_65815/g.203860  ORF Transcript_65815/g.203860 Transcript_65815/m.203860 type:complete len:91 (+) Transcript_65815:401-673(+)
MASPVLLWLDARNNRAIGFAGARCFLEAALREWGRQGSLCGRSAGPGALPGRLDFQGCGAAPGEAEAAEGDAPTGPPLPHLLGRFKLCWQ